MISDVRKTPATRTWGKKAGQVWRSLALLLLFLLLLGGCTRDSDALQDGYYTAQAAAFDNHGWKEYVTIYVSDNRIITVEYNAANSSGFLKSWDMTYMSTMNATDGTYPNKYTREYADALLNRQDPAKVDAISGATHSYYSFQLLAAASIEQSRNADKAVALVDIPLIEDGDPAPELRVSVGAAQ